MMPAVRLPAILLQAVSVAGGLARAALLKGTTLAAYDVPCQGAMTGGFAKGLNGIYSSWCCNGVLQGQALVAGRELGKDRSGVQRGVCSPDVDPDCSVHSSGPCADAVVLGRSCRRATPRRLGRRV